MQWNISIIFQYETEWSHFELVIFGRTKALHALRNVNTLIFTEEWSYVYLIYINKNCEHTLHMNDVGSALICSIRVITYLPVISNVHVSPLSGYMIYVVDSNRWYIIRSYIYICDRFIRKTHGIPSYLYKWSTFWCKMWMIISYLYKWSTIRSKIYWTYFHLYQRHISGTETCVSFSHLYKWDRFRAKTYMIITHLYKWDRCMVNMIQTYITYEWNKKKEMN